ncbi:MAG TPA: phosphoglycerate dehydrogenase, partial [Burkholderiaceae bacterium]|nr:phosphoglycerate dehydrogenase [Burkholderiaceae bacterium]
MKRILVTPRSLTERPHPALLRLQQAGYEPVCSTPGATPSEPELIRLVPGCVGWIAGVEPVTAAVIDAAASLRVISRNGVGVDNLPLELLRERGVEVLVAEGANANGVAELALALMLCGLRQIPQTDAAIKVGGWPRLLGAELRARTLGVIGCGAIGAQVLRLAHAFGARLIAHDPRRPPLPELAKELQWCDLPELLARADLVTLHCPPLADRALIDRAAIGSIRTGALLVNTARATLVDEGAVLDALESGQLRGYATDVFAHEPPSSAASAALAAHPRVIATSHVGGYTRESVDRAA